MNSRSLVLAAFALAVGVAIGVFFRSDPQTPAETTRKNSSSRSRDAVDAPSQSAADTSASGPSAGEPVASRLQVTRAAPSPPRSDADIPDREFRDSGPAEDRQERVYRDDTFAPDEPGLPFPPTVDEDGAADDFEQYRDGPVVRSEADDLGADTPSQSDRESELAAEGCLPAFASCRQDSDCCGASVCRSAPGTISGHFECTPD